MKKNADMHRWRATLAEILRDMGLIAWCIGCLQIVRGGLILALRSHQGSHADGGQILMAMLGGARFDGRIGVLTSALSLLCSLALAGAWPTVARHLRSYLAIAFACATLCVGIGDYYYFLEYHDQFNQFLLGIVYDDRQALAATIWNSYPVIQVGLGIVLTAYLIRWLWLRFSPRSAPHRAWWDAQGWPSLLGISLLMVISLVIIARGSVGRLPAQQKFSAITRDATLNKLVRNPWDTLVTAVSDHALLASSSAVAPAIAVAAAQRHFSTQVSDLDHATLRSAHGSDAPPRHVILVIMESQSAWPLLPAWHDLDLNPGLQRLGKEGAFSERFLSAGCGTMESLGTLLTGIPNCGLMAGYQPLARHAFPSATAAIFKTLGYRTRFIYAGYLSWQRLGDLASSQGFDEIHGGADMGNWLTGGEWGVDDEVCYDYASRTISDACPSFTVILTTSNHPPFSVDVHAKGFPLHQTPPALMERCAAQVDWHILGHLWYGDHCLEHFIRTTASTLTHPLFAITGDHYGRRFPNDRPDARERTGVPLVLWGPGFINAGTNLGPGSHLDLIPTLVERCAPAGFAYHAWGHDLCGNDAPICAVGRQAAVTAEGWADLSQKDDAMGADPATLAHWSEMQADLNIMGWWRLIRGPLIDRP